MIDKINWQCMLKNQVDYSIDLLEEKGCIEELFFFDLCEYISDNDEVFEFFYFVYSFLVMVKSVGFDKLFVVCGILVGIKG